MPNSPKLNVQTFGRVRYIEPNDVNGKINGVPMTPDYTDMCIAFNLICEVKSRLKNDTPIGETEVKAKNKKTRKPSAAIYQIFGVTGNGQTKSWVSFLQGENCGGDINALTTYYTDINYEDYLKQNIVEGLGVENITISHESYYTPTVTIKFIDHRGAALFGREEAIHFNDKITIDNIFGAFFTAPYPEYYLQVKGFYGRPITYRLSCSGFKGALNPQTGNFEATATFIGYSYSLLTDIPFEYLVAAPYCEYFGKDYWEEKKTQEEWRMYGSFEGDEVPTFYELIQRIEAAFTDESLLQVISDKEKKELETSETKTNYLSNIESIFNSFVEILKAKAISYISDRDKYDKTEFTDTGEVTNETLDDSEQLLLMKDDNVDNDWSVLETVWENLTTTIEEYNSVYEDDKFSEDVLPNKISFKQISFTEYFLKSNNRVVLKNIKELTADAIHKVKINNIEPSKFIAEGILKTIEDKYAVTKLHKYVYLVDLGTIYNEIQVKLGTLKSNVDEINKEKERSYIDLAINKLGMVPYIGNIFKLIMCHIETFVHMMQQCFINIENAKKVGQRSPEYLNINIKNTDFLSNNDDIFLPPWPSVNRKVDNDEKYSSVEHDTTYGWVGDFSPYFEEAKLVRSLYLACKRTAKDPKKDEEEKPVKFLYAPIIPNDLNNNLNPFNGGGKDISSMAGMLGLRAAQIFGIGERKEIDNELAKLIGKIDALNYYRFVGTKTELSDILEESEDNLADTLYNIMLCKAEVDKYGTSEEGSTTTSQAFEKANGMFPTLIKGDRHPIYAENKGLLHYTYMHTKSKYALVPSNTRNWDSYSEYFPMDGTQETGRYFKFNFKETGGNVINNTFLHCCTTTQLFSDYDKPEDKNKYLNTEMYAIVTKRSLILGIMKRHEEMSGGSVNVLGEKFTIDMKKMLEHYWKVNDEEKYWYYNKTTKYLAKSFKDIGIEDNMLLVSGPDDKKDVKETVDKLALNKLKFAQFDEKAARIDGTEVDVKDLIVPGVTCVLDGSYKSLFGIGFYYLQNQIADEDVRRRVKALLFLHTLRYNFSHTMLWDDSKITSSAIRRIPFGLAALYGGLLWRHNYIMTHDKKDPIIYQDSSGLSYKSAYVDGIEYALTDIYGGMQLRVHRSGSKDGYRNTVFKQNEKDTKYVFANKPDYFVANELIRVFDEFVSKQWPTISQLELRKTDGSLFSGSEFVTHVKGLSDAYSNAIKEANAEVKALQEEQENESSSWNTTPQTPSETTNVTKNETDKKQDENAETTENDVDPVTKARNTALKSAAGTFANFTKYYCFLWYFYQDDKSSLGLWHNTNNTDIQNALRSVYLDECLELRSSAYAFGLDANSKVNVYADLLVNPTNMKSYLSGFAEQLDAIVKNTNNDIGTTEDETVVEETKEFNRETALPIYMYLKMLWDKWLVSIDLNNHEFMVKNFNDNFIFIDSFYRNIAHRFMTNCQILLECYNNNVTSNSDITVFKFISDITTKHHCMFVAVPDFIIAWSHEEDTDVKTSLETVFVPMPYNSMGKMRVNNKFVTLYVPKLCETPSELNNFKEDGFNIWSYNDGMVINGDLTVRNNYNGLPHLLDNISEVVLEAFDQGVDLTEYAYYVPSFGIAYGRQHNHIFKNMNLSMETPAITSTVINTLSHIARIGSNNTHRIAFIGQDLYPTYSNYAYLCEFEMMGCAQIQPLMYFQLMNVPMWRGTYIIFSVTHTMTPGNMVTRVKAMKLSNRGIPYSNAWFTENPNFDPEALRKLQCLDQIASGNFSINVNGAANQDCNGDNGSGSSGDEGGGTVNGVGFEKWKNAVTEMAKWYEENVHGYNNYKVKRGDGIRDHKHPTVGNVAADCVGYVKACLKLFGSQSGSGWYGSSAGKKLEEYKEGKDVKTLISEGFTALDFSKSAAQPFDILVRYHKTKNARGHTEIYAGNNKSYSWGNIHDKASGGMPSDASFWNDSGYQKILRYTGSGS